MTQADGMQPIAVEPGAPTAVPIGDGEFTLAAARPSRDRSSCCCT